MSQQGIYETTIVLGEGDNALREVLRGLCHTRPDLVRYTPPQGMSLFVEQYTLSKEGIGEFAQALGGAAALTSSPSMIKRSECDCPCHASLTMMHVGPCCDEG